MSADKERLYADELVAKAGAAARAFESYDQAAVDRIVEAVYRAGFDARVELAQAAVDETFMGDLEGKVRKNVFASLIVYRDIKDRKTVGIIEGTPEQGLYKVAQPLGPVLSMTPVTNPTSTVINKALICLKTRNPVIFCPHKAAKKCARKAAEIVYQAALAAGAPEGCIQWAAKSNWSYTEALMQHPGITLVLATTAFHFVREAYRSGNPVLGAGEGNVPVFIDRSADVEAAARSITESKTFDHGTVCCSEQALVVLQDMDEAVRSAFNRVRGYFCSTEETEKLGEAAFDTARCIMRSDVVGQPAVNIAEKAGFSVPDDTRLLITPLTEVGPDVPMSHEILAPILAYYVVDDAAAAEARCRDINRYHGHGHTLSIYTQDEKVAERMSQTMKSGRVLINTPSSLGGLGGTFNQLHPSLTLSCGGEGKNFTSDNITVDHLLNINHVARHDIDPVWKKIPMRAWMDPTYDSKRLDELF